MKSNEIRKSFINFFKELSHQEVASAPVIPHGDSTLLFTNAGMNQFKDIFLGNNIRKLKRAVDTQKCIRVSGKHNDLEEVGRDTYHHTFFEMLGNWSFGDYYKKEAIKWGWKLLTEVWKFPKNRIWATVYKTDDEALNFWKTETDINPEHILKFAEKDNFWEMGETGPCGPCSEIHIDLSKDGNLKADKVNSGSPLMIEIWNLVFIQYNRETDGKLIELPSKHVDTGMGFERVCAVFNSIENNFEKFPSNYDTDLFQNIIIELEKISGLKYQTELDDWNRKPNEILSNGEEVNIAMRVISDHLRALSFAIADGAIPSNEGRGYVLRRILRRASRFGRILNFNEPFIFKLVKILSQNMGSTFPELTNQLAHIERVIKSEEGSFNLTLDRGLEIFEKVVANLQNSKIFSGEDAFKLYDTFGFPLDLTELLCSERNISVDIKKFDELMNLQKSKARSSSSDKFQVQISDTIVDHIPTNKIETEFIGYDNISESKSKILFAESDINKSYLILDKTPLYAESGGQVSDTGWISFDNTNIKVLNSKKVKSSILHLVDGTLPNNILNKTVTAKIDVERRNAIMKHHTATHLLHSALRSILGSHVHQSGSLVSDSHLRFDFAHFSGMKENEIAKVEEVVNQAIGDSIQLEHHKNIPFDEAKKMGAMMFFGDKYGEKVNVVQFGNFSKEFCGGTHIQNTNELGFFKIIFEASSASGVRRIEAVCGNAATELLIIEQKSYKERIEYAYSLLDKIHSFSKEDKIFNFDTELRKLEDIPTAELNTNKNEIHNNFEKQSSLSIKLEKLIIELSASIKNFEKQNQLNQIKEQLASIDNLINNARCIGTIKIIATELHIQDIEIMKSIADEIRNKLNSGVALLASKTEEKVSLVCVVTDDLIKDKNLSAAIIINKAAKIVNGAGGGKSHLATAGGKNPKNLKELLIKFPSLIEELI
ncbi:MAG: alanine--tRNA ligase [Bacteroidetes bacterium]|nr:alanine--tRNA ligase [Bacteroidota bacterium]